MKIELKLNQVRQLKNKYGHIVKIARKDNGYFIIDENGGYGPFININVELKKDENNIETLLYAFTSYTNCKVYQVGYEKLQLIKSIDTTEDVATYLDKNYDITKEEQFKECELVAKVQPYAILRNKEGQFFLVNYTQKLQPIENYRKFDTYAELYLTGYANNLKWHSEDYSLKYDSPALRKFLSQITLRQVLADGSNVALRAKDKLRKINIIKSIVGTENFKRGDFIARIYSKPSLLDLDKLKANLLDKSKITSGDRIIIDNIIRDIYNNRFEIENIIDYKCEDMSKYLRYISYFADLSKSNLNILEIEYDEVRKLYNITDDFSLEELDYKHLLINNRLSISENLVSKYQKIIPLLIELLKERFEYFRKTRVEELYDDLRNSIKDLKINQLGDEIIIECNIRYNKRIFRVINGRISDISEYKHNLPSIIGSGNLESKMIYRLLIKDKKIKEYSGKIENGECEW